MEDIPIRIPPRYCDQIRYSQKMVEKVRKLSMDLNDAQIVSALNQEGVKRAKEKDFTVSMIRWIRPKHGIHRPVNQRPEEFTVKQVADKFAVSRNVVY